MIRTAVLVTLLLLPCRLSAQAVVKPLETSDLLPAAAGAAAIGGAAGYTIGLKWRFLGSTPDQARYRDRRLWRRRGRVYGVGGSEALNQIPDRALFGGLGRRQRVSQRGGKATVLHPPSGSSNPFIQVAIRGHD